MVVRMRDAAGLVFHHEHRRELRVQPLIDQHFDRDAAVGQQRRRHARRDGRRVDPRAHPQVFEGSIAIVQLKQVPRSRVADVELFGLLRVRRADGKRVVGRSVRARLRRQHVDPARGR